VLLVVPFSANLQVAPRAHSRFDRGQSAIGAKGPGRHHQSGAGYGFNREESFSDVRRFKPDVVPLDLLLPDMSGRNWPRCILADFPQMRIVTITPAPSHLYAGRALDVGIHGYLSKAAPACEIVHAIRQVRAGARAIPGPVALETAECSRRGQDGNN
jgi:DNA-binding NarL/FixJ family response regulator